MAGGYSTRVLKGQKAPGLVHGAWHGKLCLGRSRKLGLGGASTECSRSSQGAVGWVPEEMTQGFRLLLAPPIPASGPESSPEPVPPTPSIP